MPLNDRCSSTDGSVHPSLPSSTKGFDQRILCTDGTDAAPIISDHRCTVNAADAKGWSLSSTEGTDGFPYNTGEVESARLRSTTPKPGMIGAFGAIGAHRWFNRLREHLVRDIRRTQVARTSAGHSDRRQVALPAAARV